MDGGGGGEPLEGGDGAWLDIRALGEYGELGSFARLVGFRSRRRRGLGPTPRLRLGRPPGGRRSSPAWHPRRLLPPGTGLMVGLIRSTPAAPCRRRMAAARLPPERPEPRARLKEHFGKKAHVSFMSYLPGPLPDVCARRACSARPKGEEAVRLNLSLMPPNICAIQSRRDLVHSESPWPRTDEPPCPRRSQPDALERQRGCVLARKPYLATLLKRRRRPIAEGDDGHLMSSNAGCSSSRRKRLSPAMAAFC